MARKTSGGDQKRLQALIEEATVDCYDIGEQAQGLLIMAAENVVCPFKARVIGEEVEVTSLETSDDNLGLNAVCRYKDKDYRIEISSLQWPRQRPAGFEWIEALLAWRKQAL